MGAVKTKRSLPVKVSQMKARKKQKLDHVNSPNQTSLKSAPERPKAGDALKLDELKWSEVTLPDQLDDYEGFFGLDEIEGVDVVRDNESGRTSYAVAEGTVSQLEKKNVTSSFAGESGEDKDEWSGISEDDEPATSKPSSSLKEKKSKKRKDEKLDRRANVKNEQPDVKRVRSTRDDKEVGDAELPPTSNQSAFDILEDDSENDGADVSAWQELGLSAEVLHSLSKLNFAEPTAIQAAVIPEIMAGVDLIGKAPTGSGKTLAFGLPLIASWLSERRGKSSQDKDGKAPIALIMLPTRELAHQIETHLKAVCEHLDGEKPRIATLTGGLSIQKQRRLLTTADIVVATPGRLWEVVSEGHGVLALLQQIQYLVLDEADRLLSEGHFKELEQTLEALDRVIDDQQDSEVPSTTKAPLPDRQTLVFSATFSKGLQHKLAKTQKSHSKDRDDKTNPTASMEYLIQKLNFRHTPPKFIDVNPTSQMASNLREGVLECATGTDKDLYLYTTLLHHPTTRTLVFVNSISAVRRLVPFLRYLNIDAHPLHSQMPQKSRLRSIERFSGVSSTKKPVATPPTGKGAVLVATDVAARGLDVRGVALILHYHLPRAADTYVHRSGRTARAGASGTSIIVCAPEEASGVRRLVAQVHASNRRSRKVVTAGLKTLSLDARLLGRLKPRATLAKQIADAELAREKKRGEEGWMREAADDLGVDLAEEDFDGDEGGKKGGRGRKRKEMEKEAVGLTASALRDAKGHLRDLLNTRVNAGFSERYLTNGGVDVHRLLKEGHGAGGELLGVSSGLGFDD